MIKKQNSIKLVVYIICILNVSCLVASNSIKNAYELDDIFSAQMELIDQRRVSWLEKAEQAMPELNHKIIKPVSIVSVEKDTGKSFQGWKTVKAGEVSSVCNKPFAPGDSFILDFGDHYTGNFCFSLCSIDNPVDAPVRLEFIFGEVPAEVGDSFDTYCGSLSRSWLQDEIVNIDVVPQTVKLPRRYAFRYVKVRVVASSVSRKFGFTDFEVETLTSANEDKLLPFTPKNERQAELDRVSLTTLRDCMQTVFEDGPKRDRRLWLGDLRLQAQANYVTYQNYDLVKRSLYILAGTSDKKGMVSTCAFEYPKPVRGGDSILDYTALFAPTLLDYLEASNDKETANDLWPLAVKQLEFVLEHVNSDGLFIDPGNWWLFIDWNNDLDKQASEHAIIIYSLKAVCRLAELLDKKEQVSFIPAMVSSMKSAAISNLWDSNLGLFVSGANRQISWASQSWMVLAGVTSSEQARMCMANIEKYTDAQKPVTPYLHHHVVAALMEAGYHEKAMAYMNNYWGKMIDLGADTFWEVFVPGQDFLSPYNGYLINSYCHAWSCTPTYFLRTYKN